MKLANRLKNNHSEFSYRLLFWFSGVMGAYLFFQNVSLADIYKRIDSDDPYVLLSQNLFLPNYSYLSESILLPLIAKLLDANINYQTYLTICSAITLLILPLVVYFSKNIFNNAVKSLLLILLLALTFQYFYKYWLGFPDPLTIILVVIPCFYRKQNLIFLAAFFAGLSHFSMALIALSGCAVLLYFSNQPDKIDSKNSIKSIILGLCISKGILWIWYFLFKYQLNSRLDIVFEYGISFFIKQYEASIVGFWLTPGPSFLFLYLFIFLYFIYIKRVIFAFAMVVPLLLAYTAVFLTTDGLRVFSVTIVSAYVYILKEFVNAVFPTLHDIYRKIQLRIVSSLNKYEYKDIYLFSGLIVSIVWCLLIDRAKSKGFLINELPLLFNTFFGIDYYFLGLYTASFAIFLTIVFPTLRHKAFIMQCMKIILILPLLLIAMQYLRINFYPDQAFSLEKKILILVLLLLCSMAFLKFNILKLLDRLHDQIIRLYRFIFSLS